MIPTRIAVVGAGFWGKKVIREILSLSSSTDQVKLGAVVDYSPTALEECGREFGSLDYRLDYRGLLSDSSISAVHICSPNATHFEVASDFLRAGKHVLVEKPLALRSGEAEELMRVSDATGRVLSVGHVHRFNNGIKELKRIVWNGLLGDIYYLRFRWTGFLPPQKDRDVITDLGPHPFDICNNLLDVWPIKISCFGRGYRSGASDEVAFITAEHADGIHVNVELSWLDAEKHRDVTVVGSDGVARLDCLTQDLVVQRSEKSETIPVVPSNTLREEIIHFANCVQHGITATPFPNCSSGAIGAGVVKVLETSRKSLSEERALQIPMPESDELLTAQSARLI
jgi:UDP-N-acetylglucosamine 3-dehydrogenase